MAEWMIQAENLCKTFRSGDGDIYGLKDATFRIKSGSFVALQGPSGSGKTTLLNLLGLITEPTSGTLVLNNEDVGNPSVMRNRDRFRREWIGYIFQDFRLLPQFHDLYNVCLPMVPFRADFDVERRAKELLERVGLGHRLKHPPARLSGGEQQRVAIARALIHSPKILLCDEPTGNLDTDTRDSIISLLEELHRDGLTIIVATHDEEVASRCGVRFTLRDGCLANKG